MFKTHIDGKEIRVVFQHQKAAFKEQLTRLEIEGAIRKPVFAVTGCLFDGLCIGLAYCSYSDERRYTKEIGRQVSLKKAIQSALKRNGRGDKEVAEERRRVWMDYFAAKQKRANEAWKVTAAGICKRYADWTKKAREEGLKFPKTEDPQTPAPFDRDALTLDPIYKRIEDGLNEAMREMLEVPFLSRMPSEVIEHLNQRDAEEASE